MESNFFQSAPVGKYNPQEEEVVLCEAVVEGAEIVAVILIICWAETGTISAEQIYEANCENMKGRRGRKVPTNTLH